MKPKFIRVKVSKIKDFIFELLIKAGVDKHESKIITEVLLWTDLIGRSTQGIWRLPAYIKRFKLDLIVSPCRPKIIQKSNALTIVNGNNGFGQYLGHIGMKKAIDLAAKNGIGIVCIINSNHFGASSYYVQQAARHNQLGFAFSNSVPHVAPFGGISPVLGTNPFAFGAPTQNGQSILVDFSTSASAGSVIMKAMEGGKNISKGIVIDEQGNSIVDPKKASTGTLLPFGGAKGFCLGLMVEILAGVITGAGISHEIASMFKNFERPANIGHLLIAIDISNIMPMQDYYARISKLIGFVKESKLMEGFDEIHIPGESRWRNMEQQRKEGIRLDSKTVDSLTALSSSLGLPTPW